MAPRPVGSHRALTMLCPRCRGVFEADRTFCPDDGARLTDRLEPVEHTAVPGQTDGQLVVSRYKLGELIGHGSMSRVYEATDQKTGQKVAIKILSRTFAEREAERTRFFREAKVALWITHPNVVKVLDVGRREDGRPFIVIELLHGEPLGDLLRRVGALPLAEALRIVHDAAAGLGAVHAAGIVHRDVKPDNIFLLGDPGEVPSVRLVDFGLAKLHGHRSLQVATALGTAAYMPPEQVLAEDVDARADVYSLGVVLFRVLTGHLPFVSSNDLDMLAHQLLFPSPPPSWLVDGLDARVDAVVARAMRKNPGDRYPSMAVFASDLERLLGQRDGEIAAGVPMANPDRYLPKTVLGRQTAMLLCRRIGMQPPAWLSS